MAYYNKTINDGPYGSFQADPGSADLGIYVRCKFVTPVTPTPDGKPILQLASATERGDFVTFQPITAGAYGTGKFLNAGGETFGIMSGVCNAGVAIYAAANGKVSTSSGGGALLLGVTTSPGSDGNVVTYTPNAAAA